MERAYAFIEIKSIDEDARIIEGIASTPTTDRMGDIVEPKGAEFKLPLPLLWQHQHDAPIGHVTWAKPNANGIPFKATIERVSEPGKLKDRLDEAWQSIKIGLVRAVSIGFKSIERAFMDEGNGIRFIRWEWLELSAVTIPANAEATITTIKSIDRNLRAASGASQTRGKPAGVTAPRNPIILKESHKMATKTLAEQRAQFEATLASKESELEALQGKIAAEGRSKTAEERARFDELADDCDAIRAEIKDIDTIETKTAVRKAAPARGDSQDDARDSRERDAPRARNVRLNDNLPKGIAFARHVICLYQAQGNSDRAGELADKYYPDDARIGAFVRMTPEQRMMVKAAVPAAITTGSGWADAIAQANVVSTDFIEYLRPFSVIDRFGQGGIPGFRRASFNTKVGRMTTGLTGYWVGEALPAPLSKGVFDQITLGVTKVGGITALSKEQLRFSNINAEAAIRDDLARAIVQKADSTFLSSTAASAGVSPAGIINGVSGTATAGATSDNVITDLTKLNNPMAAANIPMNEIVIVTHDALHRALSLMKTSLDVRAFPDLNRTGGELEFYPIIPSNNASFGNVIAIAANQILMADDGDVSVEMSDQASLEMLDGTLIQTGVAGTGASLVSMFQSGMVAIKIERFINWAKANSAAASLVTGAAYGGAASA